MVKLMHRLPALIAPVMLLLAWGDWPYGYYQVLRVVVSAACLWLIIPPLINDCATPWKIWMLGFILLLFNPLLPVHLSREVWHVIDPVAAVSIIVVIFSSRPDLTKSISKASSVENLKRDMLYELDAFQNRHAPISFGFSEIRDTLEKVIGAADEKKCKKIANGSLSPRCVVLCWINNMSGDMLENNPSLMLLDQLITIFDGSSDDLVDDGYWTKEHAEKQKMCIRTYVSRESTAPLPVRQIDNEERQQISEKLATRSARYIDNNDGTVTDNMTGLMWTKNANHGQMNWADAVAYCDKFVFAGHSDWRLPSVAKDGGKAELDTLFRVDGNPSGAREGYEGTPFAGVQRGVYWSGTSHADYEGYAWHVRMCFGFVFNLNKSNYGYVWPVRGGK